MFHDRARSFTVLFLTRISARAYNVVLNREIGNIVKKQIVLLWWVMCLVVFAGLHVPARAVAEDSAHVAVSVTFGAHAQINPAAAAVGENLYVAWQSNETTEWQIYFSWSHDAREWFVQQQCLSCDGESGAPNINREPAVAADPANGHTYVAWQGLHDENDYDIFLRRGGVDGAFSAPMRVNAHKPGNQAFPTLAVAPDGTVYVAWQDNRDDPAGYDIYVARSTDRGETFSPGVKISANSPGKMNLWSDVAAGPDGRVAVAWQCGDLVCLSESSDGGNTFANIEYPIPSPDRDTGAHYELPAVAYASNGQPVLSYVMNKNDMDVMFAFKKCPDCAQWYVNPAHGESAGNQIAPDLVALEDHITVAWSDARTVSDYDVYLNTPDLSRAAGDGVPDVMHEEQRVEPFPYGFSENPALAASMVNGASRLYVVWMDDFDGDYNIYAKTYDLKTGQGGAE